MLRRIVTSLAASSLTAALLASAAAKQPADYVNPFIGTTNFGTTNPGAMTPNGLMSVTPFNVMGSDSNVYDKDARWWSTPYEYTNSFLTGFSHVNLSGVGCPEMGSLLLMPTSGKLNVDYHDYGSTYTDEKAHPGYYTARLGKYDILAEVTATKRVGVSRFTFPAGEANILLNLGEGLTNESGATVRRVSDTEYEGSKLLGTFCYNSQAVFPIYFVMKVNKTPQKQGMWKKQRPMKGVEAEWDPDHGKYKLYPGYGRQMSGDDIGVWMSWDNVEAGFTAEVEIAVSFTSIDNARRNLEAETTGKDFASISKEAYDAWNDDLSRIMVEGGTDEDKTVFYTALYHTLIHPNILNDVSGDYPVTESDAVANIANTASGQDRYTVFSLWDTYRNLHQLMTLVYPDRQEAMVNSMLDIYREHGWLPKWELYGRETLTMEGDPAIPVIVDTWSKGLRNFDVDLAYKAMKKGADTPGKANLLRPDNDDYLALGYVPLREEFDNSVSHALEYYIADHALSLMADSLGYKDDAKRYAKRAGGYKNYYSKEYGTFRPKLPDGKFLTPFDPKQGENFEPSPGFHEGNAWNYTFYVPHDIPGLAKLMGGKKPFVEHLQSVFDRGNYDPANEPDIAYPYLFSKFPGEEWRTQKLVSELLDKHFTTKPDGIPGNDDTGTMSAWAIFSMMGLYPDIPGEPGYTLTTPRFDKVTVKLDPRYYKGKELVIEVENPESESLYTESVKLDGNPVKGMRVEHKDLTAGKKLTFRKKAQ